MSLHDYFCGFCRIALIDQYRTVAEGGKSTSPECPECGRYMEWIPQAQFDCRSDSDQSQIPKFTCRDGRNELVEIDSLRKLRQVEKESEDLARNGEGQQVVFRNYSQTRGNRLDNTFGDVAQEKPSAEAKRKWGLRGATKVLGGEAEPKHSYGPGVNDSNTSALDHLKP
jgi:hypothetical protein